MKKMTKAEREMLIDGVAELLKETDDSTLRIVWLFLLKLSSNNSTIIQL